MKKAILLGIMFIFLGISSSFAATTQIDSLIEKLVEKGILDREEARSIKAEVVADEKLLREEGLKQSMPEWVQKTKLKGDLRLRYQYERKKNDAEAQTRGRIRYRLGLETKINDMVKVGAGLASSNSSSSNSDDPRSTNQTLQNMFDRGSIRLDYAFAEYVPAPWAKIVGGKFLRSDYLWSPTDLLWDSDINPAGSSVHLEKKLGDQWSLFNNTGIWIMDENGKVDRVDPFLAYTQVGAKWKDKNKAFDATLAGIYYGFNGIEDILLDNRACTNSGLSGSSSSCTGTLIYDYDSAGVSAEFGINKPLGANIERLAFFSDFIHNFDPEDDENGWATGVKFGDAKVNGQNQWQMKYQYSYLGRDAFPDTFPDSDRLGGATNVRGHEWIIEYGLAKNVILGLDYYQDDVIKGTKNRQKLLQADISFKF